MTSSPMASSTSGTATPVLIRPPPRRGSSAESAASKGPPVRAGSVNDGTPTVAHASGPERYQPTESCSVALIMKQGRAAGHGEGSSPRPVQQKGEERKS